MGGPLKKYRVTMPSGTVATMKLNEEDAERLGGTPVEDSSARDEGDTPAEPDTATAAGKARSARNKARGGAANKAAGGAG